MSGSAIPKTIRDVHEGFDRREFSPTELVREYLDAIGSDTTNSYITVCGDRALEQAKKIEGVLALEKKTPRSRLPLFGVPIGIKDNFTIEGVRTTCASKILDQYRPPYTATVVERLEAAGAIVLGKLNMDEFAMGGSNENSAYGPVRNPWDPSRVPGGSSGGSAAAVSADLCVAAIGSDTGGSIRLPASYCGAFGMKPTYGRVSRYGLIAFASSLDQAGPIAKTVEDGAALLQAMAAHDPRDSTSSPRASGQFVQAYSRDPEASKLRIGIPKEYFVPGLEPAVEAGIRKSLAKLEKLGARLIPVSLPHTEHAVAVYYVIAVSEASSNLSRFDGVRYGSRPSRADQASGPEEFYNKTRALFGPEVKRRILLGTFALSSGYYDAYYRRACQVRRLIADDFARAFEQVDLIAAPVSTTTAFKLGEKSQDPLRMYLNDIFTIPANLAGLPALSMDCGQDPSNLPIGLQLIGPQFGDEALLSVAGALERRIQQ